MQAKLFAHPRSELKALAVPQIGDDLFCDLFNVVAVDLPAFVLNHMS